MISPKEKWVSWASTSGFCLFLILLPFSVKANNVGLVLLGVCLLPSIINKVTQKKSLKIFLRNFYPVIIYYAFLCLSFLLVYERNPSSQHLETRFGMIGIPILFSFLATKERRELIVIFLSFIGTITILSIGGITQYLHYIEKYGEVSMWILSNRILVMHRPIWGLYILTSLILSYSLIVEFKVSRTLKYFLILSSIITITFLILSQAKNSILTFFIIIALLFVKFIRYKRLLNLKLATLGLILVISSLFLFLLFNDFYVSSLSRGIEISLDYRYYHWYCSWQGLNQNNLIIGIGTGLDNVVLNQCYKEFNKHELLGMGSHNQYLNLLLESGIAGLAIIAFWFGKLFQKAVRVQNKSLFYFLVVVIIAMITENIFSTQKAILIVFSGLSLVLFKNRSYLQK